MNKIEEQIKKKEKELELLKTKLEEKKNKKFQVFKHNGKEIRVYKWENKQFKDFPMPKGFEWCEYFDFVDLINKELIKLEKYPIYYYTKNKFKFNINQGWYLSRLYLNRDLILDSYDDSVANSDSGGRVVVSKRLK